MESTPAMHPPRVRLRTSWTKQSAHCSDTHATDQLCAQKQRKTSRNGPLPAVPLLAVPTSDFSAYTARICPSTTSLPKSPASFSSADSDNDSALSASSSTPSINVRVSKNALARAPALRRKMSPTEMSLREIRANEQRQLQTKNSEDQLRQLYERQTMEYLHGDFASLDMLAE